MRGASDRARLLASPAEGASIEDILSDYPTISREWVRAVIAFVAASSEEDMPVLSLPRLAWELSWPRIYPSPGRLNSDDGVLETCIGVARWFKYAGHNRP